MGTGYESGSWKALALAGSGYEAIHDLERIDC
jgi:hypothetical protein